MNQRVRESTEICTDFVFFFNSQTRASNWSWRCEVNTKPPKRNHFFVSRLLSSRKNGGKNFQSEIHQNNQANEQRKNKKKWLMNWKWKLKMNSSQDSEVKPHWKLSIYFLKNRIQDSFFDWYGCLEHNSSIRIDVIAKRLKCRRKLLWKTSHSGTSQICKSRSRRKSCISFVHAITTRVRFYLFRFLCLFRLHLTCRLVFSRNCFTRKKSIIRFKHLTNDVSEEKKAHTVSERNRNIETEKEIHKLKNVCVRLRVAALFQP